MESKPKTWKQSATDAIEIGHQLRNEIENHLQSIFPGCQVKLVLRDVVLEGIRDECKSFNLSVGNEGYFATQSGACDYNPSNQNGTLFIQFIKPESKSTPKWKRKRTNHPPHRI